MKNKLEQLESQIADLTKRTRELEEQLALCLKFMRIKAESMVEAREQHSSEVLYHSDRRPTDPQRN